MTTLQDKLRACADDPMWADHCEMRKVTAQLAAFELDRLQAENEALRKDAERYRWLRIESAQGWNLFGHYTQDALDAAIDDAMK
jgi:hypothetical protein